jgi:ribonuclease HI
MNMSESPNRLNICDDKINRTLEADRWKAPCIGTVKVNVDAAFSPLSQRAAVGVVPRNHHGKIIAALCSAIDECNDVEAAEARAILSGLKLAEELKVTELFLESDSSAAVAASTSPAPNRSHIWSIYKDIADAKARFRVCSVSHIRRKLNSVAHSLAKIASASGGCKRWVEPVPSFVLDLAKIDDVNPGYE